MVLLTAWTANQGNAALLRQSKSYFPPFIVCVILYVGLRPVSGAYFMDMAYYSELYQLMRIGGEMPETGQSEWLFSAYMYASSLYMSETGWFLLTAALYCGLAALAFFLIHNRVAYLAFLMWVASYSFWSYATNGLRNGVATSVVLLAFACSKNKWAMAGLFWVAASIHMSTLLPIVAFVLTFFFKNPRYYLFGYVGAIVLSLSAGGWLGQVFGNWSLFEDDRLTSYVSTEADSFVFRYVGFRFDFLLYSVGPIVIGTYYIFWRNFRDPFFLQLFNTYVTANAFWVLVIRANFSNRFAYLSWFMMSWVIIYPLLKKRFSKQHNLLLIKVLAAYYGLTYLMHLFLG